MDTIKAEPVRPEVRYLPMANAEVRIGDVDGRRVLHGYAAVYNALSVDLGGFREVIRPGAFRNAIISADVRALINHEPSRILGRTKPATLKLIEDQRGLRYEVDLPDTQYARDLIVSMDRGDIDGSSFRFYMFADTKRGQAWREEPGGYVREITEFAAIDDVSVVTYPAYPQTEAALRSLEEFRRSQPRRDEAWLVSAAMRLRLVEAE